MTPTVSVTAPWMPGGGLLSPGCGSGLPREKPRLTPFLAFAMPVAASTAVSTLSTCGEITLIFWRTSFRSEIPEVVRTTSRNAFSPSPKTWPSLLRSGIGVSCG